MKQKAKHCSKGDNNMNKCSSVAQRPPMGWNSWDCFASRATEEDILKNAEVMERRLKQYGWEYVVCDIQWSAPPTAVNDPVYKPFIKLKMDSYSRLVPDEIRFPSSSCGKGFAPLAEAIHNKGLKFGIHIMRGIPRQAAHSGTGILGSSATASDIAEFGSISRWNGDMYGLDPDNAESQKYYDSLFELYAQWGVDFVKIDDICNTNMFPHNPYSASREIEMYSKAAQKCGRPMVLSLSPGPAVVEQAWHLTANAHMWRITDDFWDEWRLLRDMFDRCERWQTHVGAGSWPDCDMIPIGKIGAGFGSQRDTLFTKSEQVTLMTLWCVFRSPLILGCDLAATENDDWTMSLLTNEEALAANQEGWNPRLADKSESLVTWISTGGKYAAYFNISDERIEVEPIGNWNVWKKAGLGKAENIEPHGALFAMKKE
jgi:hypothetical protein